MCLPTHAHPPSPDSYKGITQASAGIRTQRCLWNPPHHKDQPRVGPTLPRDTFYWACDAPVVVCDWEKLSTETSGVCIFFALQRIRSTVDEKEQKQLLMDLDVVMRSNDCPAIVQFYGALFKEVAIIVLNSWVTLLEKFDCLKEMSPTTTTTHTMLQGDCWICMELMSISLDKFYKYVNNSLNSSIPEEILGKITVAVSNFPCIICERSTDKFHCFKSSQNYFAILFLLQTVSALNYLKEKLKIIHRGKSCAPQVHNVCCASQCEVRRKCSGWWLHLHRWRFVCQMGCARSWEVKAARHFDKPQQK